MKKVLSTNGVRNKLTALGAICPSRQAVALVATRIDTAGGMTIWEIIYPYDVIRDAIEEAIKYNKQGAEAMHRVFARALRKSTREVAGDIPPATIPWVGTVNGAAI